MLEPKDPAIKLFGKTIQVTEISVTTAVATTTTTYIDDSQDQDRVSCADSSLCDTDTDNNKRDHGEEDIEADDKDPVEKKLTGKQEDGVSPVAEDGVSPVATEELSNPDATSATSENRKTTSSIEKESAALKTSKTEEEHSDTSDSQEKTLKKPDKILPCPRCNSMDTKFCYYNNYNVNQPRHFCKNCQRYWTAGGTMRNVPVGAGRRKNKNSASHCHHLTIPEALQNVRADVSNGVYHPSMKTNGTVLTFGSDKPLHESMASVLNLADKTTWKCTRNGSHKPEAVRVPVSYGSGENSDDHSNGSSVTVSNSIDDAGKSMLKESAVQNCQGFPPEIPCYPGVPWPYPWNSGSCPLPPPAFCPPGFPMPFYPAAAYWGCTVPGAWNIPWLPQPSSPKQTSLSSGPNSPTLGKHSRDENMLKCSNSEEGESAKENNTERCLWIPKTLRIVDPGEAAKSSIWTTLGIKNDKPDSIGGQGLFKVFESKVEKNHEAETSPVLQANPAALSRSLQFQESS